MDGDYTFGVQVINSLEKNFLKTIKDIITPSAVAFRMSHPGHIGALELYLYVDDWNRVLDLYWNIVEIRRHMKVTIPVIELRHFLYDSQNLSQDPVRCLFYNDPSISEGLQAYIYKG